MGLQKSQTRKVLGAFIAKELSDLGLEDVRMDDYGYVYGYLPATKGMESIPTLGLIAHMDTSPDASGANVRPRIVKYEGGDIVLENGEVLRAARRDPERYRDLVVRIGGYSDYYVTLSPQMQEEVLLRTEHEI